MHIHTSLMRAAEKVLNTQAQPRNRLLLRPATSRLFFLFSFCQCTVCLQDKARARNNKAVHGLWMRVQKGEDGPIMRHEVYCCVRVCVVWTTPRPT